MRLLVVEDNKEIRDCLSLSLQREGFAVDQAAEGEQGLFLAETNEYDAILLDNILPKKSGLEVCSQLRQDGRTMPIILLSVKSEASEKAALLDAGADDYLTKPYSYLELVARIRAVTRRPRQLRSSILSLGDLTLDARRCEVRHGSTDIHLTPKEFALLELLMSHQGQVVSRGMIMEAVWNIDGDPFSKTIETHILNLRRKLGPKRRNYIQSVAGRGYKAAYKS